MRASLFALALACLSGCPAVGAGRALDEAARAIADAHQAGSATAPNRARFDFVQAECFLAEAKARAGHGEWGEAESWAVKARKAAEAARRRLSGESP